MKNQPADQLKKYSKDNSLIFLLRHGRIKDSSEKKYIGQTDVNLDDEGILQAEYWKDQFKPLKINAIYSSALVRCRNTAEIIQNKNKIVIKRCLNEINMGLWDGRTFKEIKTEKPSEFEKRGKNIDTFRPPEGESFKDLSDRALPCFNTLTNEMNGNILIVTHAGVIRTILCHISGIKLKNLFEIKVSYGELFVLRN